MAPVRAFVELDERLVGAQPGVIFVRAPADAHGPIAAHASRRLRASGWLPIGAAVRAGAPLFRDVALHLGVSTLPCDPALCAETLANAALTMRAAIVAPLPADGTWDRSVAALLAKVARVPVVFITSSEDLPCWDGAAFEVGAELAVSDKLRWLSAVAEEAQQAVGSNDLRSLEAWWSRARHAPAEPNKSFDDLGAIALRVLASIALAGRSLPVESLVRLAEDDGGRSSDRVLGDARAAIDELVAADFVTIAGGLVSASPWCELGALANDATNASRLAVAACLEEEAAGSAADPWARAHAADLYLAAGAYAEANAAIGRALRHGADPQVNGEVSARWFDAVGKIDGAAGLDLRLKAANRALVLGEAADAQRWCESAATIAPNDPHISLLMARALMQLGDLVAARVCLTKAETNAESDGELLARVAGERAELAYLGGELELAASHADRAVDLAKTAATRLGARGTLGKILLARGSWELADEHFAEDALTASASGETTAELRARLNRGIALLSKGRLDEARAILERVLADGTRLHEERARAYALSNLGLVAYRQHDYGAALQYWEHTVRFPQALRGRLATALTIANLADLRLRLGLVDHADHAISFGKKLLSGHAPPRCAALFKWVGAQVALAKRNTELARREIEGALVDAQASGDHDCLEAAYTVSARVALEDGDLARAAQALSHAETIAKSGRARTETAIVRAYHRRALGQPAIDSASQALQAARVSGDEDLLTEIHTLLAMLHRDAGDLSAAQAHASRAIAVRDQVANGLPADIRAAYLAKPEMVALARLQTALVNATSSELEPSFDEAPRTERSVPTKTWGPGTPSRLESAAEKRELVGDDAQMKALTIAIKKVAKSNSTVLIRGESGTGKELVAEALHRASDRATGPLVSVNCAALVETLLLSELFGHEKGAFTGASARRRGRFEMAEGGTLFLDEIGDISPRTQVALLRVLQEKTFERVGGTAPIRANVRVVCATHRDLRAMVERGEFREDLYYRLRGITLEVPALRARIADLPKIADHLLARIADERGDAKKSLSSDAVDLLARHRWPGNIRELENVLRAVSLFADGDVITATDLIENVEDLRSVAQAGPWGSSGPASQAPVSLRAIGMAPPPSSVAAPFSERVAVNDSEEEEGDGLLPEDEANATAVAYAQVRQGAVSLSDIKRQIERDCIARALAETKGNITRAAALLGMKRPRLSQLVKQYGLAAASSEGNS
ncbi:MAG: sigma 54-interacting transcriptional regulator [Labilithrix sp.]|nr:sigma 54-interacting transcriptional regulator [Labilithrix sp.]MCW5810112.1 sigma 54-interacting transcriptional regulator [Labilithrix sp.]